MSIKIEFSNLKYIGKQQERVHTICETLLKKKKGGIIWGAGDEGQFTQES